MTQNYLKRSWLQYEFHRKDDVQLNEKFHLDAKSEALIVKQSIVGVVYDQKPLERKCFVGCDL